MAAPLADKRVVVFDLDGTLVDSLPDIVGHLNTALADAGLATYTLEEIRRWVGRGSAYLVNQATRLLDDTARRADVMSRFGVHYRAAPYGRTQVFDGIADVLDTLQDDRALAVLSNKPDDLVQVIAKALLDRWPFRDVRGERKGTPRKPDPTALISIAEGLEAAPEHCVLVGDSEVDVQTAQEAGMTSVAVTWGLCDRDVLEQALPDHLVTTPAELRALFR